MEIQYVRQLLLYIGVLSFVFLVMGLFKPWMLLWWEDVQNRKKVIKLYGTITLLSLTLYWVLKYF